MEINNNPDLYGKWQPHKGPFWIPTTVIVSLFATSSLAAAIAKKLNGETYTFEITMLSFAAIAVYTFTLVVPAMIYFVGKYKGAKGVLFI
jgi:protein YIPF1/2